MYRNQQVCFEKCFMELKKKKKITIKLVVNICCFLTFCLSDNQAKLNQGFNLFPECFLLWVIVNDNY